MMWYNFFWQEIFLYLQSYHMTQKIIYTVHEILPVTNASTKFAAVTICAPSIRSSGVMPRGFVHAPQAHILPPLLMNDCMISVSEGNPSFFTSSA